MFRSLQARVTASFVAVIAATIVALGIGLSSLFGQVLYSQYQATYLKGVYAVASILESGIQGGIVFQRQINRGNLQAVVRTLSGTFHFRIQVYLIHFSGPLADSGPPPITATNHLQLDNFRPFMEPIRIGGQQYGSIVMSGPLTDRAYVQQQIEQNVAWIGVAACLLAVFIGGVLSERLTAPFRVLTRATTRMGEGHLSERVPDRRRDEAGELARQFNRMAARLEESFATISADRDRLRQFVAEVSHELRTPLTALRTFNDLLQDGAGEDAATRRDFLSESARQIERLDWLTHNLLDLSRLDSGITQLTLQQADLSETLRRAVETNRPAAAAKGVTLALDAPPLIVAHDPPYFEQALNNVIGNAVKFSPRDGIVHVRAYRDAAAAVVEVRDEGPGIPPDEVAHIFDRFYRGHDANRAGEGSGLGLAITKAIQDAHKGTIGVVSAPGHGATMRLTLPLAQPLPRQETERVHVARAE